MAHGSNEFEALAQRYWGAWAEAMRAAVPGAGADAGLQGWRDAMDAWTRQAAPADGFAQALGHANRQAGDWYALMQQVAARFAGREHTARDVAEAWKQALGVQGDPFQGLLQGMRGAGLEDLQQWSERAAPWLQGLRGEAVAMLGLPAFGFTREHQERLQALGRAQLRWQDALGDWNALMARASRDAFDRFESRLAAHEEPGRQLTSVRALFDAWVDAAEDAWAELALSPEFRRAYGELANAQMRLRADAQAIAEQGATLLGLPGRTEVDSAHRKIAELERQLRRLQQAGAQPPAVPLRPARANGGAARRAAAPGPASKSAGKSTAKPVAKPAAARKKPAAPARAKPAKAARTPAARKAATPRRKR
jgi:hypothetical protein